MIRKFAVVLSAVALLIALPAPGTTGRAQAKAESFQINAGVNDAWVSVDAPYQGFFFTIYPDLNLFFLSWFTFDSTSPAGPMAVFGAKDQRWVTGTGGYSGDTATLSMELTSGGIFNDAMPMAMQTPAYGTITVVFNHCNEAILTYEFPSLGLSGQMTLARVLPINVLLCEQQLLMADTHVSLTIPDGALPPGVTAEDLSATLQPMDPYFYQENSVEPPLAEILLEPDGIEFSEPVLLNVEVPVEVNSNIAMTAYTVSNSIPLEPVLDAESSIDVETGILTATIPLDHFSRVYVLKSGNVFKTTLEISATRERFGRPAFYFAEEIPISIRVERLKPPGTIFRVFVSGGRFYTVAMGHHPNGPAGKDYWHLSGLFIDPWDVLFPETPFDVPPETLVTGESFTIPKVAFECTRESLAPLTFQPFIRNYEVITVSEGASTTYSEPHENTYIYKNIDASIECLMPAIMADAAPPLTTYTLNHPPQGITSYEWSGANCGGTSGEDSDTYTWDHGTSDCSHAGTDHDDATITVIIEGEFPVAGSPYFLKCTYTGAATGTGEKCSLL